MNSVLSSNKGYCARTTAAYTFHDGTCVGFQRGERWVSRASRRSNERRRSTSITRTRSYGTQSEARTGDALDRADAVAVVASAGSHPPNDPSSVSIALARAVSGAASPVAASPLNRSPSFSHSLRRRLTRHRSKSSRRSIRSDVGVELKGVRSGVERRRGRRSKPRGGRRDTPGDKVLKKRRSPRRRGRMGTSVSAQNAPRISARRCVGRARAPLRPRPSRPRRARGSAPTRSVRGRATPTRDSATRRPRARPCLGAPRR
eukprot:31359-Pelagococcus_subviridis.AAC.7